MMTTRTHTMRYEVVVRGVPEQRSLTWETFWCSCGDDSCGRWQR
jgi:hypothetical protein